MLELEEAAKKDGTKVHPNGTKEAKKLEDKNLIGEALKEVRIPIELRKEVEMVSSVVGGGAGHSSMNQMVSIVLPLGKTMMEHWKQIGRFKFIEALPSPEVRDQVRNGKGAIDYGGGQAWSP